MRRPTCLIAALLLAPVLAAAPSPELTADQRAALVTELARLMEQHYVFPDKGAETGQALRADLAAGAFDDVRDRDDLARRLTGALQAVTDDKHLRVGRRPPRSLEPDEAERERRRADEAERSRQGNYGFEQVLRLPGNIGLIDLRGFHAAQGPARDAACGAMMLLSGCDALVFDLRQNGGGDPEMVQLLCSYLFDEPTHLNSLSWREGEETVEFWTLEDLPGRRLPEVPVFVLTSPYTFSGAEEFAYNLRCLERATLIGETSGGGAHPGQPFDLDEELEVFIATGRAINPITGTNWEGTGVAPHIEVPAAQALDRALQEAGRAAQDFRDRREAGLD